MNIRHTYHKFLSQQIYRNFFLAFFWSVGLTLGVLIARSERESLFPLMRLVPIYQVSIVGVVSAFTLLMLISACAVYFNLSVILYVAAFLKAFSFGFTTYLSYNSFGSAGWLISLFLLFSNTSVSLIFLLFSFRYIGGSSAGISRWFLLSLFAAIGVFLIDFYIISPFLLRIL